MTEFAHQFAKNRKPPPVPSKGKGARKNLRPVSKKRAALVRKVGPERKQFLADDSLCMVCGKAESVDVHEIAAGTAREACLSEAMLQLAVCRKCHEKVQHMPAAKQIAIRVKWRIGFICALYCELKGYAPTAVTTDEVIVYLMFKSKPPKRKRRAK